MSAEPILDRPETEVVSPELALVDPALAARARSRLADPGELPVKIEERAWGLAGGAGTETIARPAPRRQTRPRPRPHAPPRPRRPVQLVSEAPVVDTDEAVRRLVESAVEETPTSSRRRRWELFVLAPALIAAALLFASTRLEDPNPVAPNAVDTPAVVEPSPLSSPPPVESVPSAAATPPVAVPADASRDFVWAPIDGASGYHVEFYRGGDRVFAADTTRAHVEVPVTWKLDGRTQRLVPGEYRWFVWPVVDGERASTATVQSALTITGS
jgi:hypothetical protein